MTYSLPRICQALTVLLAVLVASGTASGQQGAPLRTSTLSELSATAALERLPTPALLAASTTSVSPYLLRGAGIGGLAGAAFAFAVISMADCGGPTCTQERVVGVVGHALAGAAFGALTGGIMYLIRR